jgi:phosphoribosylanthranilate isomerase
MTRIKICGLRDARHALFAAEKGADYLGFVFVPGVRRCLELDDAQRIVTEYREAFGPGGSALVGLFSDQPVEFVNSTLERVGLDLAQICGNEPLEYLAEVVRPTIRVVHVGDGAALEEEVSRVSERLILLRKAGVTATLDRKSSVQPGGLGVSFNWAIAEWLSGEHDFLLAGGLTQANVAEAIATVHPWGVDVSSGVETEGVKDPAKIEAFIAAVKATGA